MIFINLDRKPSAGYLQVVVDKEQTDTVRAMFGERQDLPVDAFTRGENELGCIGCLLHSIVSQDMRPALAADAETFDLGLIFREPEISRQEIFLYCPALIQAYSSALNSPCERNNRLHIRDVD